MKIHLAYNKIDAILELIPTHHSPKEYLRTPKGEQVKNQRFIVFTMEKRDEKLRERANLLKELVTSDPDVDIETVGKYVSSTTRITVDEEYEPVHTYVLYDILEKPDREVIDRPHQKSLGNVNGKIPVIITDKLYDPQELFLQYIFRKHYYITHSDGVTYKFLFDIASELDRKNKFAEVEAFNSHTKKREPLVLVDGGRKYPKAYIEGIINGNAYSLILHLSDQELILPSQFDAEDQQEEEDLNDTR
jgi:hypothetical protein